MKLNVCRKRKSLELFPPLFPACRLTSYWPVGEKDTCIKNAPRQKVAADGGTWEKDSHSWITFHRKAAHCLFVCIHSRVQIVICHGNSQQWQRQSGGTSTFTQHGWYLTPLSQSYPLSPRGMIMVAVSSLGCWASVRDGVVGFHFHLATFYKAKVGTNEHCWSVCSSSGAHKVTLFIDPALNSAPICGNCSLSLLNKCC